MNIDRLLDELRESSAGQSWEGTFQDYLSMVVEQPRLARHSHARVHDMIRWHGVTAGTEGVPRYNLFADAIFGLDRALDRLAQFFHAAATGEEVRRRILLLMGPPASGKSSIVTLLKQGLERYTRVPEGATYAIKGCPMQEEPLHLIPPEQREHMAREYGLHIEGDLCPRCRHALTHAHGGDISRVRVRRVHFSQSQGVGIGTFVATSPQHQDVSRLVGTVDISCFSDDRMEGAGRAFRLDGELEAANRGIMEFIEVFKSDERFLAVMLGVTQEQVIKLGSFGSVPADQVVIGHSNEEEYNAFVANKQTEALLDRLIMVRVPYTLQVTEEVRIYRKLLADSRPGGVHLAPQALPVAAVLAVLSRLEPPRRGATPRVSLLDKLRLYNGQVLPPYAGADVERLRTERPREGMYGISPRYVINRLADAMARERECLRPPAVLNSLVEGVDERAGLQQGERERLPELLQEVVREYQEMATREAQRAALEGFHQRASELFQAYVREAQRFANQTEGGGEGAPPDERLMSRVEWAVNVREGDRPAFRRAVMQAYRGLVGRGETPGYDSIPSLGRAIEQVLLPGRPETRAALGVGGRREDRARRREAVERRLVEGFGYCPVCARDLVDFASVTLQGKEALRVRQGRLQFG